MGNTARAFVAGTTAAAALLLGACGTPVPEQATTTTEDDSSQHCEVDRKTIETAVEAYAVGEQGGSYPATLQDVVDAGYLRPDTDLSVWTYSSTGTAFTLVGAC